jgi:hypothetical protein
VTLLAAGAVAALVGPATAGAATVTNDRIVVDGKSLLRLNYVASPGENNFLTVSERIDTFGNVVLRLNDAVPITRDSGCTYPDLADRTVIECDPIGDLVVVLSDGQNDLRSFSGTVPMTASGTGASRNVFDGGPGSDVLLGGNGSNDLLLGGSGDDVLNGLGGNDSVGGGSGADQVTGGDGNDQLTGNAGADTFRGQGGIDVVSYRERRNAVKVLIDGVANDGESGEGDNVMPDVENVEGGNGNDEIVDFFGAGNAFIGGPGSDKLVGSVGNDQKLVGGPGDDNIDGGHGDDAIDGGAGNDKLFAGAGQDGLQGGSENDLLFGEDGLDTLDGGPGADTMAGGAGFDIVSYQSSTQGVTVDLDGQPGDDGAAGEGDTVHTDIEQLMGGPASDILIGNAGNNVISGLDGNDIIDGGLGADNLLGGNDSDTIRAKDGIADRINCGPDSDQVDADQIDTQTGCEAKATPAVGIAPDRARIDGKGRVKLTLHCWATAAERCTGTLALQRRAAGKARRIASRSFTIASGDTETVRVRLATTARRAITDNNKLRVRAITRSRDAAGHKWTSKRTLTLTR